MFHDLKTIFNNNKNSNNSNNNESDSNNKNENKNANVNKNENENENENKKFYQIKKLNDWFKTIDQTKSLKKQVEILKTRFFR